MYKVYFFTVYAITFGIFSSHDYPHSHPTINALCKDLFMVVIDEVDNETDQSQSQAEGLTATTDQGQPGVGGQAEVADGSNLTVPGEKRVMTSPLEGSLPKKRLR